jgi:hypothetical protein
MRKNLWSVAWLSDSLAVLAPLAMTACIPGTPAPTPRLNSVAPYEFPFTFGMPASPTPWRPTTWDVTVHTRTLESDSADPMDAQHGPDCSPPPATHPIPTAQDAVFVCHDHVMTAINGGGYGAIVLMPDHMVDFASPATITWTVSTLRTSTRDWIDLWVTPFDEQLQAPLESWPPDMQGPPKDAIHVRLDGSELGKTYWTALVYRDYAETDLPGTGAAPIEEVVGASATIRSTFELDLSPTHLRVGVPSKNVWYVDAPIALGWTRGVMQLGHHSYNPTKCDFTCTPDTWHWGGVTISRATPFTLIRGAEETVSESADTETFPSPAPANAYLRFLAISNESHLRPSFDGGKTWQAPRLALENPKHHADDHFASYLTPIPAGTKSVKMQGDEWYGGDWVAHDFSIIAQ